MVKLYDNYHQNIHYKIISYKFMSKSYHIPYDKSFVLYIVGVPSRCYHLFYNFFPFLCHFTHHKHIKIIQIFTLSDTLLSKLIKSKKILLN